MQERLESDCQAASEVSAIEVIDRTVDWDKRSTLWHQDGHRIAEPCRRAYYRSSAAVGIHSHHCIKLPSCSFPDTPNSDVAFGH